MTPALKPEATVKTGVPGLDGVLSDGLPARRLYLVQGDPGTGKTTIGLQFLLEGARRKETCLYVTLSESEEEIQGVAQSHGWDLSGIEIYDLSAVEHQLSDDNENSLFNPAEVELHETTQPLLDKLTRLRPVRVVFDSLSELRMLAVHPLRYRRRLLALKQHLAKIGATTLFLDDGTSDPSGDLQLQSLAHGVVELRQRAPVFGREKRQLRVVKLRGSSFIGGHHDIIIKRGGAVVYARLIAADHHRKHDATPVSSGLAQLDSLLGGGPARGTSTLIVGPAGTGKSTMLTHYAVAAAARGERVALFNFEESVAHLSTRARGLGVDVEQHLASGRLSVQQIDPAELSPLEFAHRVRDVVEKEGATLIGIDSLNGFLNSMPEETMMELQLHELLTYLGQQGVATFLVMAQHGLVVGNMIAPIDVSYVADNVLMLRYFEAEGRVRKALSVIKKRTGQHESTIRELVCEKGGMRVGEPLVEFRGVLTGVPVYDGSPQRLLREAL